MSNILSFYDNKIKELLPQIISITDKNIFAPNSLEKWIYDLSEVFKNDNKIKNGSYFTQKEYVIAYSIFFFPQSFMKTYFLLEEINKLYPDIFNKDKIEILDLGAAMGPASFSIFEFFKLKKNNIELIFDIVEKNELPIRYAGDEFAVAILDTDKEKAVNKIEEMFKKIFRTEIQKDEKEIKISISCGISFFPEDANSAEDLLNKADEGLYYVKKGGKNNFVIYRSIAHKIEKEKLLKGILSPKEIVNFEEEKEIIDTGVNRGKGLFIISGQSGTGKTRLLKYAEIKCQENGFFNIICFTNKNDRTLPFNSLLRGINFWLDEERIEMMENKNFKEYLKYFTSYGDVKNEETNVEEMFYFLEKFIHSFKISFLIDDAENLDRYSSEFIELNRGNSLFLLCVSDTQSLDLRLIEESFLISVSGISDELIKRYVGYILPRFAPPEGFFRWIIETSNKNPFLIEEIIRYLIEKEYIRLLDGEYRLKNLNEILTLKPTLFETTSERIKGLDRESKIFLYSLSIGERYFDIYTAADYTGINRGRLNEIVDKLVQKNFISKISEDIYYFKNSMVKNMIYNGINEKTKKKLHLRMAKTLENSQIHSQFLNSVEIAKHYNVAGEVEQAKKIVNRVNSFLERIQKLPDLKRLKKLRRKSRLKEQIKFTPLKKEALNAIDLFLKRFYGSVEAAKIYPENSSIVEQRSKETYDILKKILLIQKCLIIGTYAGKLIINEIEMAENKVYIKRIKDILTESKLESIILTEDVDENSLKRFLLFTKKLKEIIVEDKSIEDALDSMGLKGIYANERLYIAIGSDYEEILEYEHFDLGNEDRETQKIETSMRSPKIETQILEPTEKERKEESTEQKIKKYINNEEKIKEIVSKVFIELYSNVLQKQKSAIQTIEKIYNLVPENIKKYICEEITSFYFEKTLPDIKEFLKDIIFKYLGKLLFYDIEKSISYINKEPFILINNLQSSLEIMESLRKTEKEKFKEFLIKTGVKEFNKFTKMYKKENKEHPIFEEVFKEKLFETKGNIINEVKDKEILMRLLEIIEKNQVPIEPNILLNLYSNQSDKNICTKVFKLMVLLEPSKVARYFEECIGRRKEKEIDKFLRFLFEVPKNSFLTLLLKIIEKKKKFEGEFSYDIQLKALKALRKFDIEGIVAELIEIAKREGIFSLKRNKENYFRLEILKLLAEHLKDKDNLKVLKDFEKDKDPSIRFFVKGITR